MTLGIDIGGTNIKGILLQGNKIVKRIKIPAKSKTNSKIILEQIFKCIEKLLKKNKNIDGIGVGVAGPVDFKNQKILNPPNVIALKNLELGKLIEKKFKIETMIDNDVHCLVLAEALLGAGKNKKMVVVLKRHIGVWYKRRRSI